MKEPAPEILRKGAVVHIAGEPHNGSAAASAYAIAFVDLRFDDGHVERWLGSGSLRDDPSDPVPYSKLVAWGADVARSCLDARAIRLVATRCAQPSAAHTRVHRTK